jgi:hypothetical protein
VDAIDGSPPVLAASPNHEGVGDEDNDHDHVGQPQKHPHQQVTLRDQLKAYLSERGYEHDPPQSWVYPVR